MSNEKFKALILTEGLLFVAAIFWFVFKYSGNNVFPRSFSVVGEGKEIAIPDIVEIKIGLINEGENLVDLQRETTKKFNQIINFLKSVGIEEKDIQTENYTIYPKYKYDKVTEIVGYTINQGLTVKVRDQNKLGEILNNAVKYGANTVSGPNFKVENREVYLEKAREKAIQNAKEKAEKIARMAGFKLGRIINISEKEISSQSYQPLPLFSLEAKVGGEEVFPKIEPGSQEIRISVTIDYEIK